MNFWKICWMGLCISSPFFIGATAQVQAQPTLNLQGVVKPNLPSKKIIEYGWDTPYPDQLRDRIGEMEKKPFDGLAFRLRDNGDQVFQPETWNEAKLKPQLKVLKDVKWGKFTDNFLMLYAASTMDWFSDEDWKKVVAQTKFCALAAKTANCKGVVFDPEPYGKNPWFYEEQKHVKTKSYAEYAAMVRKRGNQFMRALQSEMPAVKILMFYQFSMPFTYSSYDADPAKRALGVNKSPYALMGPFLDGMLEAAGPQVQFIDGNEFSYYYRSPLDFYRAYHMMRQTARLYVAPELRDKFDRQVRAGQALYADFVFNTRPDLFPDNVAITMSPEERTRWFESNTYYALQSSDEYVWLYSEKMNWWENKDLPAGIESAMTSAQGKIRRHEELGFDIADSLKEARAKLDVETDKKLLRRTAHLTHIQPGQAPVIDGELNDAIYGEVPALEPFVGFLNADNSKKKASTRSHVLYDEQNLYISFTCEEPALDKMGVFGTTHDSAVWRGDSIEISIQPDTSDTAFYHFIMDPAGVQWDAIDKDTVANLGFNPNWKCVTRRQTGQWTAEIAIPWQELKMSVPTKGATLRANLARVRTTDGELTSWSQFLGGFQEVQNFGNWVFD